MKYIAIIETDDFEDFEFFEDGNGKYLHAIDAGSVNGEWIPLYFIECEQDPILDKPHIKGDYYDGFRNRLRTAEWRYDKLRAEIESKIIKKPNLNFKIRERERNDAFLEVLDILDKYTSESEIRDDK